MLDVGAGAGGDRSEVRVVQLSGSLSERRQALGSARQEHQLVAWLPERVEDGLLAGLQKRLGMSDTETSEALDRLDATRRELHALKGEIGKARQAEGEPVDSRPGAPAASRNVDAGRF